MGLNALSHPHSHTCTHIPDEQVGTCRLALSKAEVKLLCATEGEAMYQPTGNFHGWMEAPLSTWRWLPKRFRLPSQDGEKEERSDVGLSP